MHELTKSRKPEKVVETKGRCHFCEGKLEMAYAEALGQKRSRFVTAVVTFPLLKCPD